MFSLYFKQEDSIEIDGKIYDLNVSFDNILRLIEMLREKGISKRSKLILGIKMLFGQELPFDIHEQNQIFNEVFDMYVNQKKKEEVQYDLAGKPLPQYKKDKQNYYSLSHDAEYIYASFMQAYGIDLIEEQGKLHWFKFQALLAGLPEDTKFRQVVSIRMWKKPTKQDTEEKQMRELQEIYKLSDDEEVEGDG